MKELKRKIIVCILIVMSSRVGCLPKQSQIYEPHIVFPNLSKIMNIHCSIDGTPGVHVELMYNVV